MPDNIEKSAFRRGAYVGYGRGAVWHITREGRQRWRAVVMRWIQDIEAAPVTGRTLADISNAIRN